MDIMILIKLKINQIFNLSDKNSRILSYLKYFLLTSTSFATFFLFLSCISKFGGADPLLYCKVILNLKKFIIIDKVITQVVSES